MRTEILDIEWPVALNTVNPDPRNMLPEECRENQNLIRLPNGDLRAHYRWDTIAFDTTTKLICGIYYAPENNPAQIVVFGHNSGGGFIGRILMGTETLEILKDPDGNEVIFAKSAIPDFVFYKEKIWLIGAVRLDKTENFWWNVAMDVYDGNVIDKMRQVPKAKAGCLFSGRLFLTNIGVSSPEFGGEVPKSGVVKYTEVGGEALIGQFEVGNIEIANTTLKSLSGSIVIGKINSELWEFYYEDKTLISTARLKQRSTRAGILSPQTAAAKDDSLYCFDDKGTYVFNPQRNVRVNPEQILEVGPGVIKISKPIDDLFKELLHITENPEQVRYKRIGLAPFIEEGIEWRISDFEHYWGDFIVGDQDLTVYGGPDLTGPTVPKPPWGEFREGWAYSYPISLIGDVKWRRLVAEGINVPSAGVNHILELYLSTNQQDWTKIEPTSEETQYYGLLIYKWDLDIYEWVADANTIFFKVHIKDKGTGPTEKPMLYNLKITATQNFIPSWGCGFFEDKFYIFAEDQNGDRVKRVFDNEHGWMEPDQTTCEAWNLIKGLPWDNTYNVIGFGYDKSKVNEGCLIKEVIPESFGNPMTIRGKTGKIDYDRTEEPKKIRQVMATYKGTGTITLTIYGEGGYEKEITLPEKSEFGLKEINLADVLRSKWHEYMIEASKDDFQLRKLKAKIKFFSPGET